MTDTTGAVPYIKREPNDRMSDPNQYMITPQSYGGVQQQFVQTFNAQPTNESIDPSALSMQNGNFGMQHSFGSPQNLSSSFNLGNSGFGDDELLESLDFVGKQDQPNGFASQQHHYQSQSKPRYLDQRYPTGLSMSHQGQVSNIYSSTPEGPPIQSPFLGGFNYDQFRPVNSIHQQMSPPQNGQYENSLHTTKRPSMQGMHRKSSDQRSPMTPRTPAMSSLQLGTPDSGNFAAQPVRAASTQNGHQRTLSNHFGSTGGSYESSYLDSPLASPVHPTHHPGIIKAVKSGKHASLPHKFSSAVSHGHHSHNHDSQEGKKARRRASHNAVERRRRDNINDRIHDLSYLVPQHRLDDDKVKKQLQNNQPASPNGGGTSMSPPNAATSLLAGASARRATSTAGNITIGLPIEEKEKGPNKGEILNVSVGWTRDLMWALYSKYLQEDELAQHISQLGGTWPFEITEDERRMRSELVDAMEKNDPRSFSYSRGHGSGLRVPKYTNLAGEPTPGTAAISPQSLAELSPGFHSGGSGSGSGNGAPGQPQYWTSGGHPGISFKEEDEFMEMN